MKAVILATLLLACGPISVPDRGDSFAKNMFFAKVKVSDGVSLCFAVKNYANSEGNLQSFTEVPCDKVGSRLRKVP